MDYSDLYEEAHEMMVAEDWKVIHNDGYRVPSLARVTSTGEMLLKLVERQGEGSVSTGCFKAWWNIGNQRAELEVVGRDHCNDS